MFRDWCGGHLKNRGITPIHELKGVGENLQDHLFYPISGEANAQEGINHYLPPLQQLKAAWNYFIHRKGVFCNGPLEAMAFFDIDQKGKVPIFSSTSRPCG